MEIKLPDGSVREAEDGCTIQEFLKSFSPGLAKASLAAKVDGVLRDLSCRLAGGETVEALTFDAEEGKEVFRHSAAHILAHAVKDLFPEVKVAIGPAIENGFYYDFDKPGPFVPADLEKIEKRMREIVSEGPSFERKEVSKDEACLLFEKESEPYKLELLEDAGGKISTYTLGNFTDLCRGPHVPSASVVKAFKLTSVAGAFWRGNSDNKMLQRIYGTAFPKKGMLDEHLRVLEEARKRDHRVIGKQLDLFSFHEEGPGFPFWHPAGAVVYSALSDYIREKCRERGYGEIRTPVILSDALWHTSGHWDNFRENMYFTDIDERSFAVKPMNCPGGLLIYKSAMHSYKELPLKNAELGLVHRHEASGVLHGLFRVRSFTQDDAHVFCEPSQVKQEIADILDMTREVYADFGFNDTEVFIATRPEKAIGDEAIWEKATSDLIGACGDTGLDYKIKEGEGAFYGPKIEFNIKDCIGRNWQCGTVQVDFSMPSRFELEYVGEDGKKHTPVMIHRAIFGSLERFIGILIEHYAGDFPLWLAPVQARIIAISDKHASRAAEVSAFLKDAGIRAETDLRSEKVGFKIREAELAKIPYVLVIGDKELDSGKLSVRKRKNKGGGEYSVEEFVQMITEKINKRKTD
ncbi:MAG: threonine--tRNA ligase [Fibrobacterota bacterium]